MYTMLRVFLKMGGFVLSRSFQTLALIRTVAIRLLPFSFAVRVKLIMNVNDNEENKNKKN